MVTHKDLEAVNTEKKPDNVTSVSVNNSKISKGTLTSILPAKSWNMIRLSK